MNACEPQKPFPRCWGLREEEEGEKRVRWFYRKEGLSHCDKGGRRMCVTCRGRFRPKFPSHVVCKACYARAKMQEGKPSAVIDGIERQETLFPDGAADHMQSITGKPLHEPVFLPLRAPDPNKLPWEP